MTSDWEAQAKRLIASQLGDRGDRGSVVELRQVSDLGGNATIGIWRIATDRGDFVVKARRQAVVDHPAVAAREAHLRLAAEGEGLKRLGKQPHVRVPRVITAPALPAGTDDVDLAPLLIIEFIASGRRHASARDDFECRFGHALARLHLALADAPAEGPRYGLDHDNFLGDTPQSNRGSDDWAEFWAAQRLLPQLRMAVASGRATRRLIRATEALLERLGDVLGGAADQRPCLIHGDLWSGNFWFDTSGTPVVIDPAIYRAPPEAELGMLRLFGGLSLRFERAYQELIPLAGNADQRVAVYRAHHLFNHLNLFGAAYLQSTVGAIESILSGDPN